MNQLSSIREVKRNLGGLFQGASAKPNLSVSVFADTLRILGQIRSPYSYARAEKIELLKLFGDLALRELIRRRVTSGARQSTDLSHSLLRVVSSFPSLDDDYITESEELNLLAKMASLGSYTLVADELMFQRNRETELPYNSRVTTKLRHAEKKYLKLLGDTHKAAKKGDRELLQKTLRDLVFFSRTKLFFVAQRIGLSSSKETLDIAVLRAETRVAVVIRRTAMLIAACMLLDSRLSTNRLNRSTRKMAKRRSTITRGFPDVNNALISDQSLANNQVSLVLTRLENIKYLRRGSKPVSIADSPILSAGIQVAYKALWQSGISRGPVWFRGKYKTANDVFEFEFEGIEQHANKIWEDWMASQARDAFDLNIGNLHCEAAIPLLRTRASGLDLFNRTGGI